MAQWIKNPPVVQETQEAWVPSVGWEDPLEKGKAIHSTILTWRILQSMGSKDMTELLSLSLSMFRPPVLCCKTSIT